jgi:hypothetical protein
VTAAAIFVERFITFSSVAVSLTSMMPGGR